MSDDYLDFLTTEKKKKQQLQLQKQKEEQRLKAGLKLDPITLKKLEHEKQLNNLEWSLKSNGKSSSSNQTRLRDAQSSSTNASSSSHKHNGKLNFRLTSL